MSGEKKTRFLSFDSQNRLSLGQHIEFPPCNLGWKKQIGSFLLSLISLSRGFPPPLLPCTGWSTVLSQHLWVKVHISFRRWTMFSAWTELANPPKTKSPSRCSEGSKPFSVPTARSPSEAVPSLLSGTPRETASVLLAETRHSRLDTGKDFGGVQKQKIQ